MKLINIGFGNLVAAHRLLAVVSPDSAPIKRVIQEARERSMLIDASYGRKTKTEMTGDGLWSIVDQGRLGRIQPGNAQHGRRGHDGNSWSRP